MKRIKMLLLLGLVISLCLPVAVYSTSIGGAETQGEGKVGIGVEQEFVFDRDMKFDKANWDLGTISIGKVEIDSLSRTMTKASYGVLDNLDVYVKLGLADFKSEISYNTRKGIYDAKNAFVYGLGMKGVYDLADDWLIGVDLQYLRHRHNWTPKGDWQGEGNKAIIQEWQIAPYLAKRLGNFVPYVGVKYSDVRMKTRWAGVDAGDWEKYKADDNFGIFLGTDYKLKKNWKLNLEGRFVDETAVSVACVYRF
jgi:opacity protein-like surface antigen